jgi:hypothetical protein
MECLLDWRIEEEYNLYQFLFSKQLEWPLRIEIFFVSSDKSCVWNQVKLRSV